MFFHNKTFFCTTAALNVRYGYNESGAVRLAHYLFIRTSTSFFVSKSETTLHEPYRVYIRYSQMSVNLLFLQKTSELSKFTETELALMHFLFRPDYRPALSLQRYKLFLDYSKKGSLRPYNHRCHSLTLLPFTTQYPYSKNQYPPKPPLHKGIF